ncbi:MAG: hypothetical protein NWF07_06075 [Candidatus Bathyarchaeota archaeon]|nr:hypothetical protein [Candidatus Bathyarchaeota archaeon]
MPLPLDEEGTLLIIDLTHQSYEKKPINKDIWTLYPGGLGLNTYLLYKYTDTQTKPLEPENIVAISPGLLTGTRSPTSSRIDVTTNSPLTGLFGTGNSGGFWGPRLKMAGIDSVMVTGEADTPVYLLIDEGEVFIHKADDIWGLDTYQVTDELTKRHGEEYSVMAIGPAGENKVLYAAPVFDKQHMPGRCHAGAVLGAKKLKAIAVKGTKIIELDEEFNAAVKQTETRIRSYPAWKARAKSGSMGTIGRNAEGVDFDDIIEPYLRRGKPGVYCPCMMEGLYGCSLLADIKEGQYKDLDVACAGLTLYSGASAQYGVSLPAAFYLNELCQKLGMDMFGPFFYALDLYERGVLTEEHLGYKLERGNEEALIKLLTQIAYREEIGDPLADGALKASLKLGADSKRQVPAIKGLEIMMKDPQETLKDNLFTTMSMLTNPRGGDDLKGTHGLSNYPGVSSWGKKLRIPEDEYAKWLLEWLDMPGDNKQRIFGEPPDINNPDHIYITVWYDRLSSAYNSLGACLFAGTVADAMGPSSLAALYSAATGLDVTWESVMETGERVFTLMRLYNIREGTSRKDDHWDDSFYEGVSEKGSPFNKQRIDDALNKYYGYNGWDVETGNPTEETLRLLNLIDL